MVPRKVDVHKHELAAGVGLVSLGIGLALSFAPDRTASLCGGTSAKTSTSRYPITPASPESGNATA
jgi:hypothetical protein